eukprot:1189490-Prorocentrum_minimum.AAC.1
MVYNMVYNKVYNWLGHSVQHGNNMISFYGSSCANNGKDVLNTPDGIQHGICTSNSRCSPFAPACGGLDGGGYAAHSGIGTVLHGRASVPINLETAPDILEARAAEAALTAMENCPNPAVRSITAA